MKKILLIIMLGLMIVMLTGCSDIVDYYPRLSIQRTCWRMDDVLFPLPEGYVFNNLKPYEVVLDDNPRIIVELVRE